MEFYSNKLIKYAGYFVANLDLENILQYINKTVNNIMIEYVQTKKNSLKEIYKNLEILSNSLDKLEIKDDYEIKKEKIIYNITNEQIKKIYNNLLEEIGLIFINYGRTEKVEVVSNFINKLNIFYNIIPNNNSYSDMKMKIKRLFVIFKNFEKNIIEKGTKFLFGYN